MASLVKDYESYKKYRNITFIGICTSSTGTVKSMEGQIKQFKLKPFANMLDAGGATAAAYGVPANAPFWIVVIDGGGKIAFNASRGLHWSSGPDKGKYVHRTQIEKSLKEYPDGILGLKDIPREMKKAAHYYDLQQFNHLELELRKAERGKASDEAKAFAAKVRERMEEARAFRVSRIEELAISNPLQAYREAESFVLAFPKAKEKGRVATIARKCARDKEVKKELKAEAAYRRILVPEMKKARVMKVFVRKIRPLLAAYLKAYAGTKYAEVAKGAVDAHEAALARGR